MRVGMVKLQKPQWSHGRLAVETKVGETVVPESTAAAMEPRPVGRGDCVLPPVSRVCDLQPQWSHGRLAVETRR